MNITATDIKEHREERPRLYGLGFKINRRWHAEYDLAREPYELKPGYFTFTIPSAAEQRLLEEREKAVMRAVVALKDNSYTDARMAAGHIRTIDAIGGVEYCEACLNQREQSHKHCEWLLGPCHHDGSSLAAEKWIQVWKQTKYLDPNLVFEFLVERFRFRFPHIELSETKTSA